MNINKIQIFADGADYDGIVKFNQDNLIKGFTTNPTLMKKAGVSDYGDFARKLVNIINPEKSISFEVFADNLDEMYTQAKIISSWGNNIYVKIPITNTKGESTNTLVKNLINDGIKCNVTAIFTVKQISNLLDLIDKLEIPLILSVFAGRIADTGIDPMKIMRECSSKTKSFTNCKLLWASPREILNIFQAIETETDIITVPIEMLSKLKNLEKNLEEFSLETVKMFYNDAQNAGFKIN